MRPFAGTTLAAFRATRVQRPDGLPAAHGLGTPQNFGSALVWLQESTMSGDHLGAEKLAQMYQRGEGVEIDLAYAKQLTDLAQELRAKYDHDRQEDERLAQTQAQ